MLATTATLAIMRVRLGAGTGHSQQALDGAVVLRPKRMIPAQVEFRLESRNAIKRLARVPG